jgi:hypothetical protein
VRLDVGDERDADARRLDDVQYVDADAQVTPMGQVVLAAGQPVEPTPSLMTVQVVNSKFCSMNYSQKVDEFNKQVYGIEKKDYSGLVEKIVASK